MPKRTVAYSSDPNDRVKNKDGTVRRFPNERFVGDVVNHVDWCWSKPRWKEGSVVESLFGDDRVKLVGYDKPVYIVHTKVKRKIY